MNALVKLDKRKIRQSFAVASAGYDGSARLQRQVGLALLNRVDRVTKNDIVVDIGCGTGFLTRQFLSRFDCQKMFAVDIALPMIAATRQKTISNRLACICADAESIPFAEETVDAIVSNLALQWCHALPAVFEGFYDSLKENGRLVFATFGPSTLQELKMAWATVDDYSHVNEFYDLALIKRFLSGAGFQQIELESITYRCAYPSVMALMKELKGLGAHNVTVNRNKKPTTRSQLQQMMMAYPANGFEIIASYEIIFATAKKYG